MENSELIIWRATHQDRDHVLRDAGVLMMFSFVPFMLIFCAGGLAGLVGWVLWGSLLFVPVAGIFAARALWRDRRAVLAIELRDDAFTVIRNDNTATTYPAREVRRIDVVHTIYPSDPDTIALRLHTGDRVEHTRPGPGTLPEGWEQAVTVAEVEVNRIYKRKSD
ncbi:hypothetical protein AB0C07_29240 [Actinoplanes missouriensis]|uniref:hypothetical protein n=1 Tax=Actinoplanes missouriensis TaxID=1866 RepID=UPI00341084B2